MASDFKPEHAMKLVRKVSNVEEFPVPNPEPVLNKDYYSLETKDPIPFDQLTKRIRKRFTDMDRASAGAMLDLFFLHQHWASFYKRNESFSKFIKDELQISRTHAYGVINSVSMLIEYFAHKGDAAPDLSTFLTAVSSTIEEIGIKKLIVISALRDPARKFSLVDKLLEGEAITSDDLEATIERKPITKLFVILDSRIIYVDKVELIQFGEGASTELQNVVLKAVSKQLRKELTK